MRIFKVDVSASLKLAFAEQDHSTTDLIKAGISTTLFRVDRHRDPRDDRGNRRRRTIAVIWRDHNAPRQVRR